jgi:hypothetical protein
MGHFGTSLNFGDFINWKAIHLRAPNAFTVGNEHVASVFDVAFNSCTMAIAVCGFSYRWGIGQCFGTD